MSTETVIVGYERVPDGNACDLCDLASGQRYTRGDLMPIHDGCGCGVEPLTEDQLVTPKKGMRGEFRSGEEYVNGEWRPVQGITRGRVEKFNEESVMMNAGTAAKPRWIQSSRLDFRKPTRAAPATKTDDLAHGEGAFNKVLTAAEDKAVDSYKAYGYKNINGNLRAGREGGKTVQLLDSAVQKGSLGRDTVLYRSMHLPEGKGVGDTFSDAAFVSTSLKRNVSERFMGKASGANRVLLRIRAKAGQRGGYFPGQDEAEFVLPRNTRFRLVSESKQGKTRVFEVEIV